MKIAQSHNCLSTDVQALIEPPPIPLIKVDLEEERASNIIKVKMRRKLTSAMSETHNLNLSMFEDVQPEEFIVLLKNLRTVIVETSTMSQLGRINYLHKMLLGEVLRDLINEQVITLARQMTNWIISLRVYSGIYPPSIPYTSKSMWCAAPCEKLKELCSIFLLHD